MSRDAGEAARSWQPHLRPGALRWARSSRNYAATIVFYRDFVGLTVVDEFADSFGEDGTVFGLPDTGLQLEIVRAHTEIKTSVGFDQLVFYLDGADAVTAATAPLLAHGFQPDPHPHPYWAANGAITFQDPDGRDVVFAPWVYGRDPEPVDQHERADVDAPQQQELRIDWFDGDRNTLRHLFEEAEDSAAQLDGYLDAGRVLVARVGAEVVGHLQLVPTADEGEVELKNMAVRSGQRSIGIGRALVRRALRSGAEEGVIRMLVATAAADIGNLRFYQRCGFRIHAVERDAFTPATGYPEPIDIGGIPLLDRVWLSQDLTCPRAPR
jgi:ribosomal protein S18 acetylase RimI-like enzyme